MNAWLQVTFADDDHDSLVVSEPSFISSSAVLNTQSLKTWFSIITSKNRCVCLYSIFR
jgi:hypothetical protein